MNSTISLRQTRIFNLPTKANSCPNSFYDLPPDQHFGLWLGIESGTKSQKNANFYMKLFCTFFFALFAHTRLFFRFIEGVYLHTCNRVCIFTPPAWWCVYFHALQGSVCIFMPFSVMLVFSRMHDCVCIFCSDDGVCILKLFWCFIWRNKSSDLQKKSYLWWFELATLWLVAWCCTIEPQKLLIQVMRKVLQFF